MWPQPKGHRFYWEHGHLKAVHFVFHLCFFCYTLTWQHSDFHKLSCCLSHRRTLARQWPAASQRPLPAARRGQASWRCPAGGFWCWKRWTRSMCPTWAENTDTITACWLLRAKRGLAWSSPYERCCPQHWTSCCFPVCPSGWSRAGRKVWAGCRTVWRTSSTPRCMLWATPCRPGDSTRAEMETNTGKHIWRLKKMSKFPIYPPPHIRWCFVWIFMLISKLPCVNYFYFQHETNYASVLLLVLVW